MSAPLGNLLRDCSRHGITLVLKGEAIQWKGRKPPADLLERLRRHREELRHHLQDAASGLAPDQIPWLGVARQVLGGALEPTSRSHRESLIFGMRTIPHPLCQSAMARLKEPKPRT